MTSPQSILNNIEYKLSCLLKEFHQYGDEENTISLFDEVSETRKEIGTIKNDMEMLKNIMSLILKTINKE